MFKNIVFWLEFPLFHISPLIKEIAESTDLNVVVICEKEIPQWRLDMGFISPEFGTSLLYIQPSKRIRKKLIKVYSGKDTVHIFHGLRGVKENYRNFNSLLNKPCSLGLYFEPSVLKGSVKAILRKQLYKQLFRRIGKKVDFMLALGELGKLQYINLGLNENKVYNFPYFIDDASILSDIESSDMIQDNSIIRLLFIGQLIPRKNVQLLIQAVKKLIDSGRRVKLSIIGNGYLENNLKAMINEMDIMESVHFLGSKTQAELKDHYINNDIFILPSKFDGWGVVAVEAMASGLPIIISDQCSAYSIIKNNTHGYVFKNNSLISLTQKLELLIEDIHSSRLEDSVANRLDHVRSELSASSGRDLLVEIVSKIN